MAVRKAFTIKRLGVRLLAFTLIMAGLGLLLDSHIRPIVSSLSAYQSKITATKIINDAVFNQLNEPLLDYSKLVNLSYNQSGEVISIESNMLSMNTLKTAVTQRINDDMANLQNQELGIHMGSATGIPTLNAKGPMITFYARLAGSIETTLISKFSEAGINQTRHQIILEVRTKVTALIPGYTNTVDVNTNFVLAETVIVGRVPDSYTHVVTGDRDLLGDIVDFDAENFMNN